MDIGRTSRFPYVPVDAPRTHDLDVVFRCPDGHYAIGDPVHATSQKLPPFRPDPGIRGYFGAFAVGLADPGPGEVTLRVRRLTEAQYRGGAPLEIRTASAIASNRVGVLAQGPMEVFVGDVPVGFVGGTADRTYWAQWYCLSRRDGAEEHLLGLYLEPVPGEAAEEDPTSDGSALERVGVVLAASGTPLLRTDFSDDHAWSAVVAAVTKPAGVGDDGGGYEPAVTPFDDRSFDGVTGSTLADTWSSEGIGAGYVLLADARSMSEAVDGSEVTVEYVDLSIEDAEDAELFGSYLGRSFRCVAEEVVSVEANLAIANMDFSDFADNVDDDGVFRGFENHR